MSKQICKCLVEKNTWPDFDEYITSQNSVRFIIIKIENWDLSICSCGYWKKNYICNHVISIANTLNLNKFPPVEMPIEGNRTKGRPKKALSALSRNSNGPANAFITDNLQQPEIDNEISPISSNLEGETMATETLVSKKRQKPKKNQNKSVLKDKKK